MRETLGEEPYLEAVLMALRALTQLSRLKEAGALVDEALVYGRFQETSHRHLLRVWAVIVSLNAGESLAAFDAVRYACNLRPHSIPVWNLFNKVICNTAHSNHHYKFILRCLQRNPTSVPCMVLMGHHCHMAGSTKFAIGEYLRAYKAMPNEPIINLLIGVGYISHVMSRRCQDRHTTAIRAFTFLFQYARLRQWSQEVYFNLGRAFHQLSLLSFATPCYEHVLAMAPPREGGGTLDLKREAAYNLSLIAMSTGASDTARHLIATYCTF